MKKIIFLLMSVIIFIGFLKTEITEASEEIEFKKDVKTTITKVELPNQSKLENFQECKEISNWLFDDINTMKLTDVCSNFTMMVKCSPSFYTKEGYLIATAGYKQSTDRANIYINNKEFEFSYTGGPAGRLFVGIGTKSIEFMQHLINTSNSQSDSINIKVKVFDESKYIDGKYIFDANNVSGLFSFETLGFEEALKKFWVNTKCENIK